MGRRASAIAGLAAVVALAVLSAGCGGDDSDDEATTTTVAGVEGASLEGQTFEDLTGKAAVDVGVFDNSYRPQFVEVSPGTEVTFTNDGRNDHNVVPVVDGAFEPIEIAQMEPGMSAALTFDEPGDYAYYCTLHGTPTKGMHGGIRVVE